MSKTLVIVESPTKAKTISKFLGSQFIVESSFGHIRDLPKSKMGIDLEHGTFEPQYQVSKDKTAQVKKLKELAKKCDDIIFATDEDREGEAISWHLAHIFDIDPNQAKRIVFHEITKTAIEEALKNPRTIDQKLVDAQQARRVLDRLVGYELSPFLWKKIARGLSAGRVQSVAVRLVVEREREIQAFEKQEYWTIHGTFGANKKADQKLKAQLFSMQGKKLEKFSLPDQNTVDSILKTLEDKTYHIANLEKKRAKRTPPPPFSTSTLQQVANNKLKFSSKQTMVVAQQLYEGIDIGTHGTVGLITYMRTDSNFLSEKFLKETDAFVNSTYGKEYQLESPRRYKTKSKGAQEAHEAIRPTDPNRTPESLAGYLNPSQLKLYTLIWKRAVATQMADAQIDRTSIDIDTQDSHYRFRANGQTIVFPGWLTLFPEFQKEEALPPLKEQENVEALDIQGEQHFTEPPARYSDATLVKALEEYGIGRPSTYAPTIATIENRKYVERDDNKRIKPLDIAFLVNDLLTEHFQNIVDYQFTAQMEQNLDEIAEGTKDWKPIISTFYHPFHENIVTKNEELEKSELVGMRQLGVDPKSGKPIFVRVGRYGPFVQKGSQEDEEKPTFAPLQKGQSIETLTLEDALHLFQLPRNVGSTDDGEEIIANIGRFGPYIKVGSKFYSLKEDDPYTISLDRAKAVLQEAKEKLAQSLIKTFPDSDIVVKIGRYGPYITDGKKNAKIPKDTEPKDLDFETCKKLIAEAPEKKGWGRRKAASKTPKKAAKKTVKKTTKKTTKKKSKK